MSIHKGGGSETDSGFGQFSFGSILGDRLITLFVLRVYSLEEVFSRFQISAFFCWLTSSDGCCFSLSSSLAMHRSKLLNPRKELSLTYPTFSPPCSLQSQCWTHERQN